MFPTSVEAISYPGTYERAIDSRAFDFMKANIDINIINHPDTLLINYIRYLIDLILMCRNFLSAYGVEGDLDDKAAELVFSITGTLDCARSIKSDENILYPVICFRVAGENLPGSPLGREHSLCAPLELGSMHELVYQLSGLMSSQPELFEVENGFGIPMKRMLKIRKLMFPWED